MQNVIRSVGLAWLNTCVLFLWALLTSPVAALVADDNRYAPEWAGIVPTRVIKHTDTNNDSLVKAVAALQPGDQLQISAGTYSIQRMWDIRVSGTPDAPVWIVAEEGAQVVITRPDAKQNVMNIGQSGAVKYLCLRGVGKECTSVLTMVSTS